MFSWKGGGEAVSSLSSLYCTAAALRLSDWLQATGVGLGGGEELREEALQMQLFPSPRSYCGRRSWCSFCSFTQWWWSWSWSWWWWQILWSTIWKLMHDHVGLFYIILLTRAMKMTLSKFFVGKSFAFTEKKKPFMVSEPTFICAVIWLWFCLIMYYLPMNYLQVSWFWNKHGHLAHWWWWWWWWWCLFDDDDDDGGEGRIAWSSKWPGYSRRCFVVSQVIQVIHHSYTGVIYMYWMIFLNSKS